MTLRTLLLAGLSVLLCLPRPLDADVILVFDEQSEWTHAFLDLHSTNESRSVVSMGTIRARLDRGTTASYIWQRDQDKLVVLMHHNKTYSELPVPIELEAYFPEEAKDTGQKAMEYLTSQMELTDTSQIRVFGAWRARLWRARVTYPLLGYSDAFEFWISMDPDFDTVLYEELMGHVSSLDPKARAWMGEILALEGVVIGSEARKGKSLKDHGTSELVEVREQELGAERYEVPADYTRVPFRFDVAIK